MTICLHQRLLLVSELVAFHRMPGLQLRSGICLAVFQFKRHAVFGKTIISTIQLCSRRSEEVNSLRSRLEKICPHDSRLLATCLQRVVPFQAPQDCPVILQFKRHMVIDDTIVSAIEFRARSGGEGVNSLRNKLQKTRAQQLTIARKVPSRSFVFKAGRLPVNPSI